MGAFFTWLEATSIAIVVKDSLLLTGGLSAVHVLGMTLITGGAFVSNMRLLGVLLASDDLATITRAAGRGLSVGLMLSVASGLPLFMARATAASVNPTFRTKMLILVAASLFQFTVHHWASQHVANRRALRLVGAMGLCLWVGVATAGVYYILLGE